MPFLADDTNAPHERLNSLASQADPAEEYQRLLGRTGGGGGGGGGGTPTRTGGSTLGNTRLFNRTGTASTAGGESFSRQRQPYIPVLGGQQQQQQQQQQGGDGGGGGEGGAHQEHGRRAGQQRRHTSEISSSLPVQMLMYYNVCLSAVFLALEGGLIVQKLKNYYFESQLQRLMMLLVFLVWTVAEVQRFYFGWAGNLHEMVPQMSAFMLMTLFPQCFCVVFLTTLQEHIWPADKILGGLMLSFLILELVCAYFGLRNITRKRTAQFLRVAQEEVASHHQD